MRILVACEFSGIVRDAFAVQGHDVWSCDILPSERPGNHIQDDVLAILGDGWDMMIAHPPCTYTSQAGYRWFKRDPDRIELARQGFEFFMQFINAPIPRICVENTRGLLWKWYRRPDQIVHPYYFGDPVTKATCLWLLGLPKLWYTKQPDLFGNDKTTCDEYFVNWTTHRVRRAQDRSRTFVGIANAMAAQWGAL